MHGAEMRGHQVHGETRQGGSRGPGGVCADLGGVGLRGTTVCLRVKKELRRGRDGSLQKALGQKVWLQVRQDWRRETLLPLLGCLGGGAGRGAHTHLPHGEEQEQGTDTQVIMGKK